MSSAPAAAAKAARKLPSFKQTTSIVARALGMSTEELLANFRRALPSDLSRVLELRRQEFGSNLSWDDAAYLTWRYRFGNDERGRGECWVVERGSELLGILGTEEVDLNGAAGPCQALFLMDILIREDVRGIALGPWMNMAIQEKCDCVAVYGSNDFSKGMVMGQFPEHRTMRTYTYYLRCDTVLRRRLDVPVLSSLIAAVGNLAMRCWRVLRLHSDSSIRVSDVVHLAELAPLIREPYNKSAVSRERTASFLEWRVITNPRNSYHMLIARRDHVPTAYLVVRESARALLLVDWFCAPTDNGASLRAIVRAAIKLAASKKHELVTTACLDPDSATVLTKMGFVLRPRDDQAFVYNARPMHPIGRLGACQWYLTRLDGDVD